MAEKKKIGLREVRGLEPGETVWDSSVVGFGARRQRSEAVAYVLHYRTKDGRQRWHTIGRHGSPWTPDTARDEARRLLGDIVAGADPASEKQSKRQASTVAELCDLYLADAEAGHVLTRRRIAKKPSTLETDRGRIERHIKPLLGRLLVRAVTTEDVRDFMRKVADGATAGKIKSAKKRGLARVRGGKGTASRTVGLLGAIFTYAVDRRLRSDNPVRGVVRPADGKRDRRLSEDEYRLVGDALRQGVADDEWPAAISVARFLVLTGWRLSEALGLRWPDPDLTRRTARLPDTKSGFSLRPLSRRACEVLREFPAGNGLVFQPTRGDGIMTGFPKMWKRMAEGVGLPPDVTSHVFRHSFMSLANDLGYSEATIADMVGHRRHGSASRYIHSADAVLLAAADAVAEKTAALMGEATTEAAVIPLRA